MNKKVSDLARKLDYIGINLKERRNMIKICMHPLNRIFNSLEKTINNRYEHIKREMDKLEEEKEKYKRLSVEQREEYGKLYGEIRYITLRN